MAAKPRKNIGYTSAAFNKGDRVRLLRLDGTASPEIVTIYDLWGDETSNRNASFLSGNCEQFFHTDLMRHEDDTSPIVIPDGGVWYIARGNQMGWGRAQTIEGAVRNMQQQGKCSAYVVHRVSKWTQVTGMGDLSYPEGIEPVEVKRVDKKKVTA